LGIVHRDLKPDNIMITKGRDGSDVVKVVDFGIAKAMGGEEGQKVTRTGLVVGTPEYMSPEQLSGDVLDGRSDIYSLALVLFRILTGRLPFEADNAQEVMIKRLTDEPTRLNDALPGANFPEHLQAVMGRALERMPNDRYPKASEFARDVVRAVSGVPSAATSADGATQLLGSQTQDQGATEQLKQTRISQAKPTAALGDRGAEARRTPTTPETPLPRTRMQAPAKKKKRPVVMIAASTVIVATAAGVTAVALTGGEDGQQAESRDSTQMTLANDTSQTPVATSQQVTNPPDSSLPDTGSTRPAVTTRTDTGSTGQPVAAQPQFNADSALIEQQIGGLVERILDDNPTVVRQARGEAQQIFADARANSTQRAQVAYQLASSYSLDGMGTDACTWIDRALDLDPNNVRYTRFQQDNCSQ
jgi:serine/threonine-protein kinase